MDRIHPQLAPAWTKLETEKNHLIASLRLLPNDQLISRSADDAWSTLEILSHLCIVERGILKIISNKIPKRKVSISDRIAYSLLVAAMYSPFKFRAPRYTIPEKTPASLNEISLEWDDIRKNWDQLLSHFPAIHLNGVLFSHPRAKGLTLPQTLRWLSAHQQRHVRQIHRLQRLQGQQLNENTE